MGSLASKGKKGSSIERGGEVSRRGKGEKMEWIRRTDRRANRVQANEETPPEKHGAR